MKIKKLLVSQPKPASEKSPYFSLAKKYGLKIDFRPFIKIEPVPGKEFRHQKISILDFSAVIFLSRTAISHFFRICDELRIAVPDGMKYFCVSEQVSLFLQKFVVYRKRKVFCPESGRAVDLIPIIQKHSDENFMVPVSDVNKDKIIAEIEEKGLKVEKAVMYKTVSNDFTPDEPFDYDMIIFFSPNGVSSLLKNFPEFDQGEMFIATLGGSTAKAVTDAGLRLDVSVPNVKFKSMTDALDFFIGENHKSKK